MRIAGVGTNNDTLTMNNTFSQNNAAPTLSVRFNQNDNVIKSLMQQKTQLQKSINEIMTNKKLAPSEVAERVKAITQQIADLDQQIATAQKEAMEKTVKNDATTNSADGSDSANVDNSNATATSETGTDNSAAVICSVSGELKQVQAAVSQQHKMKDRIEVVKSNCKLDGYTLKYENDELANLQSKLKPLSEYIGSRFNEIDKEDRKMRTDDSKDDGDDIKTDPTAQDKKKDKIAHQTHKTTGTAHSDKTKQSRQALARIAGRDVQA